MPDTAVVISCFAIIAMLLYLAYKPRFPEVRQLALLGLLYPAGELLQQYMLGPRWARWHLSDAGFIPEWMLMAFVFFGRNGSDQECASALKFFCGCAIVSAMGFECVQFLGFRKPSGDPVDMVLFIIVGLYAAYVTDRLYARYYQEAQVSPGVIRP